MSTIQLKNIVWPVFKLANKKPHEDNGAVFYYTEYLEDQDSSFVSSLNIRYIDNKNLPGKTLGLRRLELKKDNATLYPIKTAVYFLADLIKLATYKAWFIDSAGTVFQYKKSTRAKLRSYKLKQVLPAQGLGCVLEVEGVAARFKSMQRPEPDEQYVALLNFSGSYLLYGYSTKPIKDTWRFV
jgi:hypothetical protein